MRFGVAASLATFVILASNAESAALQYSYANGSLSIGASASGGGGPGIPPDSAEWSDHPTSYSPGGWSFDIGPVQAHANQSNPYFGGAGTASSQAQTHLVAYGDATRIFASGLGLTISVASASVIDLEPTDYVGSSSSGANSVNSFGTAFTVDVDSPFTLSMYAQPADSSYVSFGVANAPPFGELRRVNAGESTSFSGTLLAGRTYYLQASGQDQSNAYAQGIVNPTSTDSGAYSWNFDLQLNPVPIPAAVWLFGGALGALGLLRRKQATA